MGMTDDFEVSLQVLRGFDADISLEVNEIKVKFRELFLNWCYVAIFVLREGKGDKLLLGAAGTMSIFHKSYVEISISIRIC